MLSHYIMMGLGSFARAAIPPPYFPTIATDPLPVHNISRIPGVRFENLAVRSNGQILSTTTMPNASIYQFDPLSILPPAILHTIPNVTSCMGIVEGEPDVFYVASGDADIKDPTHVTPSSYNIFELDVRNVSVLPNGELTQPPLVQHIASLPEAALPNGIALSRPRSKNLLVADTFRGLIWNINITSGEVGVSLNDSTTRSAAAGANGLKVFNDTMYWDNVGTNTLWKIPIDETGNVSPQDTPSFIAANVTCDDFVLDAEGTIYVAGPYDLITQVDADGKKKILAGEFNSTASPLAGPTALQFGRLESDRWSLYITTNGGIYPSVMNESENGMSRIDLGVAVTARMQ